MKISFTFMTLSRIILFQFIISLAHVAVAQKWNLYSPDKKIRAVIRNEEGILIYAAYINNKQVIEPSMLGIDRDDAGFSDQ